VHEHTLILAAAAGVPTAGLLAVGSPAGHDPEDHVLPHGLFQLWSGNVRLPLFGDQAGSFWFTNHLLMTLIAAAIMLLVFPMIARRYQLAMAGGDVARTVPKGFASLVEGLMDALRNGVVRPVLGPNTDRFMPFLWTVFFFILINNLLGLVPLEAIANLFGLKHVAGTATGNVNVTGGLALCAFLLIHFSGIREVYSGLVAGTYGQHHGHDDPAEHDAHGHGHHEHGHAVPGMAAPLAAISAIGIYLWNFAPHVFARDGAMSKGLRLVLLPVYAAIVAGTVYGFGCLFGETAARIFGPAGIVLGIAYGANARGAHPLNLADAAMWGFLFVLEAIGALVKPFALCMRLFANMIAGHIVLASLLLLIPAAAGFTASYLGASLPIVIGCVLLSGLELFVAFLQSYIFMFLTTMFIGAAIHPEH